MALSEFHESTILKTDAAFGFDNFACSPEDITERLGLNPDETRTKGEFRTRRDGSRLVVPFSTWSIASNSMSKDINEHLRELLARLRVAKLPFSPDWGEASFGVLWKSNYLYAGTGPFYEPDVLCGIAALGAALYQDIYQVDEELDEAKSGIHRVPKHYFGDE